MTGKLHNNLNKRSANFQNVSILVLISLAMMVGVAHSCKLSLEKLTAWQKDSIQQMRTQVKSELTHTYMNDDLYLARWLAARNFHLDEAVELLRSNLEWRKSHQIDTILKEDWKEIKEKYPYQIVTSDKQDRPLLYIKLGAWNIAKMSTMMNLTEMGRYFSRIMEETDSKVWKARAEGKNTTQFTILLNMKGYTLRNHGCLHCLSFYSSLGETLQTHFPRVAERVVFINAPPMFEVVFNTLQRILNIDARSSIDIFGPDKNRWEAALLTSLERDQFPRDLKDQKDLKRKKTLKTKITN